MRVLFDIERLFFVAPSQQQLTQFLCAIEARIIRIAYARYLRKLDVPLMGSEVVEAMWKRLQNHRENGLFSLCPLDSYRLCWTITRRKVLREVERLDAEKRSGETKETHYGTDVDSLPIQSVDSSIQEFECNEELDHFLVRLTERQKQIVRLRIQGYCNVEISGLIGITYRNVERQSDRIAEKGRIYFGNLLIRPNSQLPRMAF